MARDQDAGLALLRMRKARADAAAKTLPPGDALDRRTHDRHLARGDVEHAFDRARVPGRAFAFHPAAQSLQHGFGIKGKVGGVHRDSLYVAGGINGAMHRLRAVTRMTGGEFVK